MMKKTFILTSICFLLLSIGVLGVQTDSLNITGFESIDIDGAGSNSTTIFLYKDGLPHTVYAFDYDFNNLWNVTLDNWLQASDALMFNETNYYLFGAMVTGGDPVASILEFDSTGSVNLNYEYDMSNTIPGSSVPSQFRGATSCGADFWFSYNNTQKLYHVNHLTNASGSFDIPLANNVTSLESSNNCETFWSLNDIGLVHHFGSTGTNLQGGFNSTQFYDYSTFQAMTTNGTDLWIFANQQVFHFWDMNGTRISITDNGTIPNIPVENSDTSIYFVGIPGDNTTMTSVNFSANYPNGTSLLFQQNGTYTLTGNNEQNWTSPSFTTSALGAYTWNYTAYNSLGNILYREGTFTVSAEPIIIINNPTGTITTTTPSLDADIADANLDTCWMNITTTAQASLCLGSSCMVEFTCGTNPSIPDVGTLSDGTEYILRVTANDTTGFSTTTSSTFTVNLPGSSSPSTGGGGSTTIIQANTSLASSVQVSFDPVIVRKQVFTTPNELESQVLVKNLGESFSGNVLVGEALKPYVTAKMCTIDLTDCERFFDMKSGETRVLIVSFDLQPEVGAGFVGTISLEGEENSFSLPVSVTRAPFYEQAVWLSEKYDISELWAYAIIFTIISILVFLSLLIFFT